MGDSLDRNAPDPIKGLVVQETDGLVFLNYYDNGRCVKAKDNMSVPQGDEQAEGNAFRIVCGG